MKIAIHQNHAIFNHSTMWDNEWIRYCKENSIDFEVVNCFENDILEKLQKFDILLWHFSNYSLQEMMYARTIINCASNLGLNVFPDFKTAWHFDDKVAETYLLKTINAPMPNSYMFYTYESAKDFLLSEPTFPIIAKLRSGSGSNNVTKLNNSKEGIMYAKKMFRKGIKASPSILFKTKSNLRSSKDWNAIKSRMRRIPDFMESIKKTRVFPREQGYVYFQDFIPNNGFDLKVVVVGEKLSFLSRNIRKGDFRASGGGSIEYSKELITQEVRRISFEISKKLGFQCMGYDFVIDNNTMEPKIIEISYGFSHKAQMDLGGYWDKDDNWHDEPLNAPVEIIKNLISY